MLLMSPEICKYCKNLALLKVVLLISYKFRISLKLDFITITLKNHNIPEKKPDSF